jgi:hypothetical protein
MDRACRINWLTALGRGPPSEDRDMRQRRKVRPVQDNHGAEDIAGGICTWKHCCRRLTSLKASFSSFGQFKAIFGDVQHPRLVHSRQSGGDTAFLHGIAMPARDSRRAPRHPHARSATVPCAWKDILDTWFSSASAIFHLGRKTPGSARFYPTDTEITARQCFRVRMIMMGPSRRHSFPRLLTESRTRKQDEQNKGISSNRWLMDQYGADAVRFTLSSMAVPDRHSFPPIVKRV